jgi:hypothetical protein
MFQLSMIGELATMLLNLNPDDSQRVIRNATTYYTKIMARKNIQMYFKCHKCFIYSPFCSFKKIFRIFKLFVFQNII